MNMPRIVIAIVFCVFSLAVVSCQKSDNGTKEKTTPQKVASSAVSNGYISDIEYMSLHPEEKQRSEKFAQIVQDQALPVPSDLQSAPVTIAVIYPGQQASDYWRRSVLSFTARMRASGIKFDLQEFFSKGGGVETGKQEAQIREALDQDPDYLVFTLDVNQHKRVIERILTRGRPHLILQNITTPLASWEGNQPFYVGFDHATGARMLADFFLSRKPVPEKYGLLYYSQGYVSTMRGDTFQQYLRENNGPDLVAAYYTDGQRAKSREAASQLLKEDKLDFIYACSTDVALGAVDSVKDAGMEGKVLVNGWGGGDAELTAIERGELAVTVMRINDDNGVAMAEAIRLALLGREDEIPTIYSGSFALVTTETSAEQIKALTERAFRYSGVPEN
jgi:autoinducer 2-binding periplasmic protein LuxP